MIRAGTGISSDSSGVRAVERAAHGALAGGLRPDVALLFVTASIADPPDRLLDAARSALGTPDVVGASAHGVIAGGTESESAAVAVMALSGMDAAPFCLTDLRGREAEAGDDLAAQIGQPRPEDLIVVLPDPHLDVAALVRAIARAAGPARVVGAGSADALSDRAALWCRGRIETDAVAGVALRGARPPRIGVTQACRPVAVAGAGSPDALTVTRVRGNWILELDGRPALDVYREAALGPLADDLARAARFVLVAFPRSDGALQPGGYLVRHVVGFSVEHGAFAVPTAPKSGDRIAFAIREPEAARADLKAMLAGLGGGSPALGLYFNCCARGSAFFGVPGLEAAYLGNAFGALPVAGMFGSCEIGPIGFGATATTELLTYTGVLALLDA